MSTYPSPDSHLNHPSAPPSYMAWSIISLVLSTITCCLACYVLPAIGTAIAALVFSSKVNSATQAGDAAAAAHASKQARLFNLITAGLYAVGLVVGIVMFFAMGGIEAIAAAVFNTSGMRSD